MYHVLLKKSFSILLCLALCLSLVPAAWGLDLPDAQPTVDTAAFGADTDYTAGDGILAWTNDAEDIATMRLILNAQTLHPQKTGWKELDELLETMIAEAGADADTCDKLLYMYNWLVTQVTYSFRGYSYTTASVKCYNSFTQLDYLSQLHYEEGLQKSIPDDMANRTYHVLTAKQGVCYDYSIAIAVIARYIGIEAYVHTGLFVFEDTANGSGHHGWAVLELGGKRYVFDPQRDARNYQYYGHNGYYFGIPQENAYRYLPNYSNALVGDNKTANAQRDASMLPVVADRKHPVTITLTTEGDHPLSGGGKYISGDTVTITAGSEGFSGWYDASGRWLSGSNPYTFTATEDCTITARFHTCPVAGYLDNPMSAWYHQAVDFTLEQGFFKGTSSVTFAPEMAMSRAMLVTVLYRMSGDTAEGDTPFPDVIPGSWYADGVAWAWENSIITGFPDGAFHPEEEVTREQMVTILFRYAQLDGREPVGGGDLTGYSDCQQVGAYARDAMGWACANGIIQGSVVDGLPRLSPLSGATRAQVAQILYNYRTEA